MSRESIIDRELDEEFIKATILIQNGYDMMPRHDQTRIESWIEKLAKITVNHEWKKNRNNYIKLLLRCVEEGKLTAPFDKQPPQGSLLQMKGPSPVTRSSNMSRMMKTDEIERLIQANLLEIKDEEFFDLSPRDTFPNRTVKFDTSTIFEVTPSKSNRYRGGRDSLLQQSKRDTNRAGDKSSQNQRSERDHEEEEDERWFMFMKI